MELSSVETREGLGASESEWRQGVELHVLNCCLCRWSHRLPAVVEGGWRWGQEERRREPGSIGYCGNLSAIA